LKDISLIARLKASGGKLGKVENEEELLVHVGHDRKISMYRGSEVVWMLENTPERLNIEELYVTSGSRFESDFSIEADGLKSDRLIKIYGSKKVDERVGYVNTFFSGSMYEIHGTMIYVYDGCRLAVINNEQTGITITDTHIADRIQAEDFKILIDDSAIQEKGDYIYINILVLSELLADTQLRKHIRINKNTLEWTVESGALSHTDGKTGEYVHRGARVDCRLLLNYKVNWV
jgi:hypothetical protein